MQEPILKLCNITKKYPGVVALQDVSLEFYCGKAHAVIGENGAGKSTLIKIITGAIDPTGGEIWFEGQKLTQNNPQLSLKRGISAIYQELNLLKHLSVAENIFYNRFIYNRYHLIDYSAMEEKTKSILLRLGVRIDPKTLVSSLTVGYQQLVEIAKALSHEVKVLILDEPSAPLTDNEIEYLFNVIDALKKENIAIIYISHRLDEVFRLCETVTILRDGCHIDTMSVSNASMPELIKLMVNRELSETFPQKTGNVGERILEVRGLTNSYISDISFNVKRGERLGLAGLVGAGRTETARAIFGADPVTSGEIILKGKAVNIHSPNEAIRSGIAYLSEDRKQLGLFMNMFVSDNISFSFLPKLKNKLGLISKEKEASICVYQINRLSIKTPSPKQIVRNLSGGNQQKVILAKWLLMECDIIIFDEPTRGIDVGAKQEIYRLINQLSEEGKAVIIISSEMPELLGMSDRVVVMYEGKVAGELERHEATQERVLKLASGVCLL